MTDQPSDDFDELLHATAGRYNRPPEVPRERMWTEIRAERARRSVAPVAHPPKRRFWVIPAAIAATLIIGIAIGRAYDLWRGHTTPLSIAKVPPESVRTTPDSPPRIDTIRGPEGTARLATRNAQPETPNDSRATRHAPRVTVSRPFNDNSSMAYRLAVVEHLAGTEAMLTSFRAAAKRGEVDAQITSWARNLLTTTRLLQASAAADDPVMKRLLDDLELVLVQIAQYTSASPHRAEELELIEHSIERRGVIGKLHNNIPARLGPAGT